RRYMIDMLKHWVREFDLDGFRCDAAGMVPTDFWEQARTELDALKPGLFMLAEWDQPALMARAFDVDYAWKSYAALADAITGRMPASVVREQWQRDNAGYERGALRMRFSDNHDETRAIARFGEAAALAASALVFTLDGVPLLYNGMEVGDATESGAPANTVCFASNARRGGKNTYAGNLATSPRRLRCRHRAIYWKPCGGMVGAGLDRGTRHTNGILKETPGEEP